MKLAYVVIVMQLAACQTTPIQQPIEPAAKTQDCHPASIISRTVRYLITGQIFVHTGKKEKPDCKK